MRSPFSITCFHSPPTADEGGGNAERPSRKERERERHKMEVLDAAESLLVGTAYHEISVQQIAEAAEFSVGFLYKLFENKEQIYITLIARREQELLEEAQKGVMSEGTFAERLLRMNEQVFRWLEASPAFSGRNFLELSALGLRREHDLEDLSPKEAASYKLLDAFLQEGKDAGELCDAPLDEMTMILRAMLVGTIEGRRHQPEKYRKNLMEYPPILTKIFMRAYGAKEYND